MSWKLTFCLLLIFTSTYPSYTAQKIYLQIYIFNTPAKTYFQYRFRTIFQQKSQHQSSRIASINIFSRPLNQNVSHREEWSKKIKRIQQIASVMPVWRDHLSLWFPPICLIYRRFWIECFQKKYSSLIWRNQMTNSPCECFMRSECLLIKAHIKYLFGSSE